MDREQLERMEKVVEEKKAQDERRAGSPTPHGGKVEDDQARDRDRRRRDTADKWNQ